MWLFCGNAHFFYKNNTKSSQSSVRLRNVKQKNRFVSDRLFIFRRIVEMEDNRQFDDNNRANVQGGEGTGANGGSYGGNNGSDGYSNYNYGSNANGGYGGGGYNNNYNNGYNDSNYDGNGSYDNNGYGTGGFEAGGGDQKKKGPGRIIAAIAGIALIGAVVCGAAWGLDKQKGNPSSAQDKVLQSETTTEAETTEAAGKTGETDSAFGIYRAGEGETDEAKQDAAALPGSAAGSNVTTAEEELLIESTVVKSSGLADVSYTDAVSVVEHDMPAIVSITSTVVYQNFSQFGYNPFGMGGTYTATGAGSGVIIGDDGTDILIVTNNHVVADSDSLTVTFCNETTADAAIKGTNANNDLAVVAVPISSLDESTLGVIRAIEVGDSDSLVLGQRVIAIGNALGLGQSVTTGVISATSRQITTDEGTTMNLLQTDAAINPGNSGGALLDASGRLIGINVAKSGISGSEGVGFAIPITGAKSIITELMNQQTRKKVDESQYPYLGVKLQDINSSIARMYNMPVGIMVYSLEPDSPAEKAGIRKNDIITKFDGQTVSSYSDLSGLLPYYAGGTTVDITVQRFENGEYGEVVVPVTLVMRSDYSTQR
jgi:serine protease Do